MEGIRLAGDEPFRQRGWDEFRRSVSHERQVIRLYSKNLSGKTILVVDDELDCLQLTRLVLEMHGARVFTATSVAGAMEVFTEHQPDLVLTDVCMPDETGLTLVEKIRVQAGAGGKTPTIAMSARTELHDRAQVMSAGFDHFLPKPYLPEALVGLLHRVLES